ADIALALHPGPVLHRYFFRRAYSQGPDKNLLRAVRRRRRPRIWTGSLSDTKDRALHELWTAERALLFFLARHASGPAAIELPLVRTRAAAYPAGRRPGRISPDLRFIPHRELPRCGPGHGGRAVLPAGARPLAEATGARADLKTPGSDTILRHSAFRAEK